MKPVTDRYASAKRAPSETRAADIQEAALRVTAREAAKALPWLLALTILLGLSGLAVSLIALMTLLGHGWSGLFTAGIALTLAYLTRELWQMHVEVFRLQKEPNLPNLTELMFRSRNLFAGVGLLLAICIAMQLILPLLSA